MNSRERIQKFLNMELAAVTEDFHKKFSAPALHLLNESEELFIGQLIKFDNGEMMVRFKASRAFPRKGEYVQAMYLPKEYQNYRKWEGVTYETLFGNRLKGTEAVCIWQSKANEEGYVLLGFRGIDISFAEFLSKTPNALVFFGPLRPPIDYLASLYKLSQDEYSKRVSDILDYPYSPVSSQPILIKDDKAAGFVLRQIASSSITILQGPPGTGKTKLIADICSELCKDGKSVLITALTNRALIEVASKPALSVLLTEGRILKTNLTIDEQHEVPKLALAKQILPIKGAVMLGTYYVVSGFAAEMVSEGVFDVVIMDEASQALTPMFAASNKIGKTNLWVGDTAQLGPVIALNEDRVAANNFWDYVEGMATMTTKRELPVYQLTRTYRLTQRNADYTGLFYNGTLQSACTDNPLTIDGISNLIHSKGGPTLLLTDMPVADVAPKFALDLATFIVYSILKESPKTEVAVLSCFRKSVRALQKGVALRLGLGNKVLIDTIARVQGLTTDITIVFIPNTSLIRSLEPRLFNVATSRAKNHTIIVADKDILSYSYMDGNVRKYLERLRTESSLYISADIKSTYLLAT